MRRFVQLAVVIASLACAVGPALPAGAELVSLPTVQRLELGAPAGTITYAPDGRFFLVTAAAEGREQVFRVDVGSWTVTRLPLEISSCYPLCLSPDGRLLVYGFGGSVHVMDMAASEDVLLLPGKPRAYSFSPDGRLLVAVNQTNRLTVWDAVTWREVRSFQIPCSYGDVGALAFAAGGGTLVLLGETHITTWSLGSRTPTGTLEYPNAASIALLLSNGEELAVCHDDGMLRFLRLADWQQVASVPLSDLLFDSCLGFAPDTRYLLSAEGAGGEISIRSSLSGSLVAKLAGDPLGVSSAAFCPTGSYVVSVGRTGKVCVWDATTLEAQSCRSFEITEVDWQHGGITITNCTGTPLDLLGWAVSDGETSHTMQSSLWLPGGASCVIYPDVFGPGSSRSGMRIDATDTEVLLLAPEMFGSVVVSRKRQ